MRGIVHCTRQNKTVPHVLFNYLTVLKCHAIVHCELFIVLKLFRLIQHNVSFTLQPLPILFSSFLQLFDRLKFPHAQTITSITKKHYRVTHAKGLLLEG